MKSCQKVRYTWESDLRWQGQNQTFRFLFFRWDTFQETYVGQSLVVRVSPAAVIISSRLAAVETDIQAGGGQRGYSSDVRSRWAGVEWQLGKFSLDGVLLSKTQSKVVRQERGGSLQFNEERKEVSR